MEEITRIQIENQQLKGENKKLQDYISHLEYENGKMHVAYQELSQKYQNMLHNTLKNRIKRLFSKKIKNCL